MQLSRNDESPMYYQDEFLGELQGVPIYRTKEGIVYIDDIYNEQPFCIYRTTVSDIAQTCQHITKEGYKIAIFLGILYIPMDLCLNCALDETIVETYIQRNE